MRSDCGLPNFCSYIEWGKEYDQSASSTETCYEQDARLVEKKGRMNKIPIIQRRR